MSKIRFAKLLESGDYSDFTLTCQGQTFAVHKAIVCSQSPVIAAALRVEFKEARTNSLEISSFDATTAKRMISFMYTGEYYTNSTEELASSADRTDDKTGVLLLHVRMNAIADYYDIPKLSELACSKVKMFLEVAWSAHGFTAAVEEASSSTADGTLQRLLGSSAAQHVEELMNTESFTKLDVLNDFTLQLLRGCVRKIKMMKTLQKAFHNETVKLEHQVADEKRQRVRETDRADKTVENIDACLETLAETRRCRSRTCNAEFNCHIEEIEGHTPSYLLRCSKCRCKHS